MEPVIDNKEQNMIYEMYQRGSLDYASGSQSNCKSLEEKILERNARTDQ